MTNSRYLSLMDLGRIDLLIRSGIFRKIYQQKCHPVLGSATIRWRKALNLFDHYELHTKILAWDEKWVYIEQRIICQGAVHAIAIVKGLFTNKERSIPIQQIVRLIEPKIKSPKLPQTVNLWIKMEEEIRNRLKAEHEKE